MKFSNALLLFFGKWARRRMLQDEIKELIADYEDNSARCEAAFQRGFTHGENKAIPILKKLERAESDVKRLRAKYKGEVGSLRAYINRFRELVPPETFQEVMQEKHPVKPSKRPRRDHP